VEGPAQGVVAVVDLELVIAVAAQSVEKVPGELRTYAVVQSVDEVAALIVGVVRTGILTQQVVHQPVALRVLIQRTVHLLRLLVQQVTRRVEREGLHTEATGRLQQSPHQVVLVGQVTATAVVDIGQLPGRIVLVLTLEQCGLTVVAAQQLLLQAPGRVARLGLHQLVALMAHHFTVQVIALVAEHGVMVEFHARAIVGKLSVCD